MFDRYFQGGSAEWGSHRMRELCPNLVPTEIALKVAAKIRARQPFAAYILIPFWQVHEPPSLCTLSVARSLPKASTQDMKAASLVGCHMHRTGMTDVHASCRSEGPPKSLSIQEVQYWCVTCYDLSPGLLVRLVAASTQFIKEAANTGPR